MWRCRVPGEARGSGVPTGCCVGPAGSELRPLWSLQSVQRPWANSPALCTFTGRVPMPLPPPALGPGLRQSVAPPMPAAVPGSHPTSQRRKRRGPSQPGSCSSSPRPRSAPRGRCPCPRFADGGGAQWLTQAARPASLKDRGVGRPGAPVGPGTGLGGQRGPRGTERGVPGPSSRRGRVPRADAPRSPVLTGPERTLPAPRAAIDLPHERFSPPCQGSCDEVSSGTRGLNE